VRYDFGVRVKQLCEGVEVGAVPGIKPSANHAEVILRHRLPPFGSEALGGCARLVDVGVIGQPRDHAFFPSDHSGVEQRNIAATASRSAALADPSKDNTIAEVEDLQRLDPVLLVTASPLLKESACRSGTLIGAESQRRHIPHGLGTIEAEQRFPVAFAGVFIRPTGKLN